MKKIVLLAFVALFFASCTTQKPLYDWHNYDRTSYRYQKNGDEESIDDILESYKDIIKEQKKGTRGTIPPGVYADYGFLLLQAGQTKRGADMLKREIKFYPESRVFIERILKMIEE
jgi:hypothetical protein